MSEAGKKLIAAVRARAEANPDFEYEWPEGKGGCVNVLNGKGSCIVGCGAMDTGLITAAYEDLTANEAGVQSLAFYLAERHDISLDQAEMDWLKEVQEQQDLGTPWGQAVRNADEYFAEEGWELP